MIETLEFLSTESVEEYPSTKKLFKLKVVAIFLAIIILGLVMLSYYREKIEKETSPTIEIPENIVTSNPFFTMKDLVGWETNGWWNPDIEDGIAEIHPQSKEEPTFLSQKVSLSPLSSKEKYILKVRIGNVAKYHGPITCNDNIIKIKMIDHSTDTEIVLYDGVVNTEDGWHDLSFDVSEYAGKEITIKAESYAGGPCALWDGEWGAIDYFYIEKV